jgi:hypothetical protein
MQPGATPRARDFLSDETPRCTPYPFRNAGEDLPLLCRGAGFILSEQGSMCAGRARLRPPVHARTVLIMSEPFRPYEKLVEISIYGKKFQVPERNSLLRCFQFISPETIPYGRFCWNQDCQYCRVTCQLPDDEEPREMLSCKFIVMPGMEISELSQELRWCLRAKLPADTTVSS